MLIYTDHFKQLNSNGSRDHINDFYSPPKQETWNILNRWVLNDLPIFLRFFLVEIVNIPKVGPKYCEMANTIDPNKTVLWLLGSSGNSSSEVRSKMSKFCCGGLCSTSDGSTEEGSSPTCIFMIWASVYFIDSCYTDYWWRSSRECLDSYGVLLKTIFCFEWLLF